MRTRKRRRNSKPDQNLDSFLDILTNTVGVLMFISLFVTLIAVEADSIVKTPLASETKKTARFFEIRENKVTYLNTGKVGEAMDTVVGNLPSCNKPDFDLDSASADYLSGMQFYKSCVQNRANRLINFRTQTEFYNITMVDARTFTMSYEPIPNKPGENAEELALTDSKFNQTLAELDPQKDYLAFIVRPDSFSSFRAAREQAWGQGFQVGWEPHKTEDPIVFGSGGRAIGVQ
ncbi:MAG: hypothetical protein AB4372_18415 [Xenococcus sp. (in: cyanobacteria)]